MALENYALLFGSFVALLIAAEIFINGIEWAGHKLGISEGATGSILAAIGTVLPETMIPIIAIFFTAEASGEHVGVGAILGAPFMLATIVMFMIGANVLVFSRRRSLGTDIILQKDQIQLNLIVFFVGYILALAAALVHNQTIAYGIGVAITVLYVAYLYRTITSGEVIEESGIDDLRLGKGLEGATARIPGPTLRDIANHPHSILVVLQVASAFAVFVTGAQIFVSQVTWLSQEVLHVPIAVVSLLIAPLATELPETFNSYFWIMKDKDTLAVGNITGAMAFQGTIPATIGILFTSWNLTLEWGTSGFLNAFSVILALIGGGLVFLRLYNSGDAEPMRPVPFLIGGLFYAIFIVVLVYFVMNFDLAVAPH